VQQALTKILAGQERPPTQQILRDLAVACTALGEKIPARATVYAFVAKAPTQAYRRSDLPQQVQSALFNLDDDAVVPGHQVAFACLNHGGMRAVCFAAGLQWLALYQAARMRGWRDKSRGLILAVLRARGIQ
jgi:hypothetical protein